MNRLPAEVLNLIFTQLAQRDQLQCMTVCRKWHDIVYGYNVYRVIYIRSDLNMDSLIKSVQKNPVLGENVERLTISLRLNQEFNGGIIVKLFPNLREFNLTIPETKEINRLSIIPQDSYPWCDTIEKMVEISTPLYSKALINSGICRNLSHIVTRSLRDSEMSNYMKSLVNTPVLKTLELHHCDLRFSDLELLHESVPLLSSLVLIENTFYETEFPLDVTPAASLKSFKCFEMTFVFIEDYPDFDLDENDSDFFYPVTDYYSLHLPYISEKYTHVEELILDVDVHEHYDEEDYYDEARSCELIRWGEDVTDYLEVLGTRLKTLSLNTANSDYSITAIIKLKMLDKYNCEIKTLELGSQVGSSALYNLKNSTLVRSIHSITLNGLIVYNKNTSESLKWLKFYTNLKELALQFYYTNQCLKLNDLVHHLGKSQLETLRLAEMNLSFDYTKPIPVYSSLKDLTLSRVTFEKGTDIFLSKVFPNLKYLELHMDSTEKQTLMLPNTDLISLKVKYTLANEAFPILVISSKNNQQRLYNHNSSRPFDEAKDSPIITIMCHSLYDFVW